MSAGPVLLGSKRGPHPSCGASPNRIAIMLVMLRAAPLTLAAIVVAGFAMALVAPGLLVLPALVGLVLLIFARRARVLGLVLAIASFAAMGACDAKPGPQTQGHAPAGSLRELVR